MTTATSHSLAHFAFSRPITFDASGATTWAQILTVGAWKHPQYGDMAITPTLLRDLKSNFDAGAREFVYVDYDHGTRRADGTGNAIVAGEVRALELRNNDTELWAEYEPTQPAREKIAAREYRKTSADFETNYTDKHSGRSWGPVLCGFALTNRPFIEGMQPVALAYSGDAQLFAEYRSSSARKSYDTLLDEGIAELQSRGMPYRQALVETERELENTFAGRR